MATHHRLFLHYASLDEDTLTLTVRADDLTEGGAGQGNTYEIVGDRTALELLAYYAERKRELSLKRVRSAGAKRAAQTRKANKAKRPKLAVVAG